MSIEMKNLETQEFTLNMGPQHPSTHGVFRAVIKLDGEIINSEENVIGYLHRGIEKIAETRTYTQVIPYTDRLDYVCSALNNFGYVLTVEKLMEVEVPERAEFIRVIMAELQRVASHLVYLASFSIDLNATTGWMYAFTMREMIMDLFEMACGSRMMTSYMRIGGVAADLPEDFLPALDKFLKEMQVRLDEYENFFAKNEIFISRTKNIAILDAKTALEYGVTGPNLRAAGIKFDLRKDSPYSGYEKFNFDVPVLKNGDCYDRYYMRMLEVRESLKIIKQAADKLPEGPVIGKVPKMIKPPVGEVYQHIEHAKGHYGFYLVSDGGTKPYRLHIHSPSFVNIGVLPKIAKGLTVQDFVCLLASLDFILGEVDR